MNEEIIEIIETDNIETLNVMNEETIHLYNFDYNEALNKPYINGIELKGMVRLTTNDLINNSGFITKNYHDDSKQDKLIAGANIQIVGNVISATGGGSGSNDYPDLTNKPKINGVTLIGDVSLEDLGIQESGNYATIEYVNSLIGEIENTLEQIDTGAGV